LDCLGAGGLISERTPARMITFIPLPVADVPT
jgi:hypothetical protein